jgi:hypothetical protein
MFTYTKLHSPAIECKEGLCTSRLGDVELLLELKIEQKQGTSRDSPCYNDATSFKQSYGLSVPVIYFDICEWFHSDLASSSLMNLLWRFENLPATHIWAVPASSMC